MRYLQTMFFVLLFALTLTPGLVNAADKPDDKALSIELNSLAQKGDSCRVRFVMRNGLGNPVEALKVEIVLFGKDGKIDGILTLNAGSLPAGKTRVKQFRLKNCADVARILINDVSECKGKDLSPKICLKSLKIENRTEIGFGL